MSGEQTTARRWASEPLTFEKIRRKHSHKKSIRFRITHRTQQAYALEKHATTDAEREMAKQLWREVDELKRRLKEVDA